MRPGVAALLIMLIIACVFTASADSLTLTFVGDISIGDAISSRGHPNSFHSTVSEKGLHWPFSLVQDILHQDDLTVANLEGSITGRKKHKDIRHPLVIAPEFTGILQAGGIDVVNTANNHALDFFAQGYRDTLAYLDAAGIGHFGTLSPPSKTGVDRQFIVEAKGVKIGFMGYTYPQDSDLRRIEESAARLRRDGCAIIVLSLHWGRETHMAPSGAQYSFAKRVLEYDIDLIYGHHPHVVQPIALYEGKPVLFSAGNFTFGTMSKVDRSTGMFQISYDLSGNKPRLSAVRAIPCVTSGAGDFRPVPVTDEAQRREIFKKMAFRKPTQGFDTLGECFLDGGEALFPAE
ncbi:MAG: CapA family protein [Eubacteriales bacterium]|nr:CapA family protein [Eubacteriales bacterium]